MLHLNRKGIWIYNCYNLNINFEYKQSNKQSFEGTKHSDMNLIWCYLLAFIRVVFSIVLTLLGPCWMNADWVKMLWIIRALTAIKLPDTQSEGAGSRKSEYEASKGKFVQVEKFSWQGPWGPVLIYHCELSQNLGKRTAVLPLADC